eukprot:gene380-6794_t
MIPSKNLRRQRKKTYEYEKEEYDFDVNDISDLPDFYKNDYKFSEFDMAYPTSFTGKVLPKDLPQQSFMGINLCERDLDTALICQLKMRFDKYCQEEIKSFIRCRYRRDKAVSLRTLQYETWKVKNEDEIERNERIKDINNVKNEIENNLVYHLKEGNKLKIIEIRIYK